MLKKHNLVPVIFYAELNNFSGLQSCNLLYLYVSQISCLTFAQQDLTACSILNLGSESKNKCENGGGIKVARFWQRRS